MRPNIESIVRATFQRLKPHSRRVGLDNVDESTFRSFFLVELMQQWQGAKCQTEWHWFDLLAKDSDVAVLVEFKFYFMRQTCELDDRPAGWKGGAGPQNQSEFWKCVQKLHKVTQHKVQHRFLILVYQRAYPRQSKYSFAKSYDNLPLRQAMKSVKNVKHCMHETLACKIIEVVPQL